MACLLVAGQLSAQTATAAGRETTAASVANYALSVDIGSENLTANDPMAGTMTAGLGVTDATVGAVWSTVTPQR